MFAHADLYCRIANNAFLIDKSRLKRKKINILILVLINIFQLLDIPAILFMNNKWPLVGNLTNKFD